jgi:hypothetical protein
MSQYQSEERVRLAEHLLSGDPTDMAIAQIHALIAIAQELGAIRDAVQGSNR